MSDESEALLNEGEPITLADGTDHRLIFDFEALMRIEALGYTVNDYLSLLARHWDGPIATVVRAGIIAGLSHERGDYSRAEDPPLDPREMNNYLFAINKATLLAFPQDTVGKVQEGQKKTTVRPSRGPSGTTSRPSSITAAKRSSAA